jgi:hypothetical protein
VRERDLDFFFLNWRETLIGGEEVERRARRRSRARSEFGDWSRKERERERERENWVEELSRECGAFIERR